MSSRVVRVRQALLFSLSFCFLPEEMTWRDACRSLERNEQKCSEEEEKGKVLEERNASADVLRDQILEQLELLKRQIKKHTSLRDDAARSQADLRGDEERVRLESEQWEKKEIEGEKKEEERKDLLASLQRKLANYGMSVQMHSGTRTYAPVSTETDRETNHLSVPVAMFVYRWYRCMYARTSGYAYRWLVRAVGQCSVFKKS